MGYEQSVLRRATARLEARRKAREEAQERLRSEIYAKLPRVAAIDRELRRTITQIIAASLRDGSDPVPAIGVIRDKNLSLQAEKAALLTEHGYPADALDDKPACPKCSDTGWVGANMCACLKALCTEEQIRELSKLLDLGEQSFDSFSLDYYSPLPWPGSPLPGRTWSLSSTCAPAMPGSSAGSTSATCSSPARRGWARPSSRPASPAPCRRAASPWCTTRR
ncbi:MAG: hypothetical protein ACLRIS_13470 [Flavonifractor plautii]